LKSTKATKHIFLPNLNGLRFLGALLVFIFHIFTLEKEIWGDFFSTPVFQGIFKIASKGHHGVGLFFALSGFLITFLLLSEIERKGRINVPHFLKRRVLRIWPLYFIILLFGFFIFPHLPYGIETIHSPFFYALFLSNLDEIWVGAFDSLNFLTITWSVSIEEQFYLVWIALLGILPFFRNGKLFPYYFGLIILASVVFRFFNHGDERTMYYHTFAVMSDLAIGGLAAFAVKKAELGQRIVHLNKWIILLIYGIGILCLLASTKIFQGELRSIERLVQGAFFAFVVVEQVYCKNSFVKMDRIPGFKLAGELTYGFYMYHCIFIYYWSIFFENQGWTNSLGYFILYAAVVFSSTYVVALFSMKYIERPILKLKERFR
jgi:peptidoglycan/LPS O-acetylase OafA/YrhL